MAVFAGRALAYAGLFQTGSAFSCIDELGQATDYWHALKENSGYDYYYHDNSTGSDLEKSAYGMSETNSNQGAIMATIHQLYGSLGSSFAYAMYNDETPDGHTTSSRAHSKGVMLFDGTKGFWLIHSFPKWPSGVGVGNYEGLSSTTYGQSFMCVTFGLQELEAIAEIQQIQYPLIYSSGVSADLASSLPNFSAWIGGYKSTTETETSVLTSFGGRAFTHFGKSKEAYDDLYADLVAPGLKSDLRAETWVRGQNMPAFCKPDYTYEVVNITRVTMSDGRTWKETQDHAKWVISDSGTETVCVGDTNRMYSQEKRGGGTLCYQNSDLWSAFDGVVTSTHPCGEEPAPSPEPTPSPSPPSPAPSPTPTPSGDCGGAGVRSSTCRTSDSVARGCVYVYSSDEEACDLSDWGCYAKADLPEGCPEASMVAMLV